MSDDDADPIQPAHIAPIILIGIAVEPGHTGAMGYVVHEDNLAAVVESGAVHDLLNTISKMLDHPSIMQAVQDQDLMDRLEVR